MKLTLAVLAVALLLTACNTIAGAGADSPAPETSTTTSEAPPPPPPPPPPEHHVTGERPGWETAAPRPDDMHEAKAADDENYAKLRVYYATDRHRADNDGKVGFDGQRGTLSYGTCVVSIPRDHRMGHLEAPSIWRLEFREDPAKHVVLLETVPLSEAQYFSDVSARVRRSSTKSAFVFVHGFNVTFKDAARRTAQMAYDLGFDGAPVFYSWPSRGNTASYTIDEQNVEWAERNLANFLDDFLAHSDAQNIYLIGHSMGNRALTRALARVVNDRPADRSRLREIILTAPDIDAEVFRRDLAPALASAGLPVTLYAAADDLALRASREVHGEPRAGDAGGGIVIVGGVETIDATGQDVGFLGHSYFGDSRSVLGDIYTLVHEGKRAKDRFGLVPKDVQAGEYWAFKP